MENNLISMSTDDYYNDENKITSTLYGENFECQDPLELLIQAEEHGLYEEVFEAFKFTDSSK